MPKAPKEAGLAVLLLVLCIFVSVKNSVFLSPLNLQNTGRLIGLFGILGLAMAVVIVTGGIDLSVGSVCALLGVLMSIGLTEKGMSPTLVVLGIIALGCLFGAVHAFLISKIKLQPFVVTLCGLLIYRGMARFVSGDETKGLGDSKGFEGLKALAIGTPFGIPAPLVAFLALSVILWIVLHRSIYGRHLFAVGKNEEAARFAGINTGRVIGTAYVIAGGLAGVASVLFAFYANSIAPSSHGNFYELYGIAAAVLGGFSLRGGEGSVVGVLLGTALLQVLKNLVNLLGIPSSLDFAVMGGVILIGTLADALVTNRRRGVGRA